MINLIIPGEPTAKGRPRLGKGFTYTPPKTVNYETLVKELFIISKQEKLSGMLEVTIECYFSIPKSTSTKNNLLMKAEIIRPVKKPDLDNLAKICLDALNKLAYEDDSQVVSLLIKKFYSEKPRVEILITEINHVK